MESNKNKKDELNYKQAYYYLFNKVTETIATLKEIQQNAEDICIDDKIAYVDIDINNALEKIANYVRENNVK